MLITPENALATPEVQVLTTVTPEVVEDFERLLPQLTGEAAPPRDIITANLSAAADPQNPDSRIVVILDDTGRIQATATGTICRIPTGNKAWVDDVITDAAYRGCGCGERLMESLHDWFLERGVTSSNLTTSPHREAAGRLYERQGYEQRTTRVYRLDLLGSAAVSKELS
jgi:GNAT superfamily N-acetyltransferase